MIERRQSILETQIKFRPAFGLEKAILNSEPIQGKVYFATDTKKIYYSDGTDFLPMGGNSGIYYGNMVLEEEPDSDQTDFTFKIIDIEGNQIPNIDDLILNIPDGCFYRVVGYGFDESEEQTIETTKLTIAGSGSGGGGGGGGGITSRLTIKDLDGSNTKYFTADTTEAKLRFSVVSTLLEGNGIVSMTYSIGNVAQIVDTDYHDFGEFEFNLLPYIPNLSTSVQTTITIRVEDVYGTLKTFSYYVNIIELTLESKLKDNILITANGTYNYYCVPKGGTKLTNRQILYKFYDSDGNRLIDLDQSSAVSSSNVEITKTLQFTDVGVYKLEVSYIGTISGTETIISSNILSYQLVYYGENPILVAYLPEGQIEQYDTVDIDYILVSTTDSNDNFNITLTKNTEEVVQTTRYNQMQKWSIYFDAAGAYDLSLKDTFNNLIEFNNIIVNEYTGEMPVIDPTQTDLYLSAVNRSNTELYKDSWTYKDYTCSFENFIWGNINGWLKDNEGSNALHLSSGAKLTVNNYYPYSQDKNIMTNNSNGNGQTIELDFKVSGVVDFEKPLIQCLSKDNNGEIQVGFNITGQESTLNTKFIKATESEISEDENSQIYNTAIQGLTTKFIENERIHLTWVIQRNYNNDYPLIMTYLNGILSGITKYDPTDEMVENRQNPAKIIIDSTYGDIDIYNIRVYKKPLDSKAVLDNYIATLGTPEERVKKYQDNTGLLDNDNNISIDSIEGGSYKLSVPYIKITGGQKLSKDSGGYKLNASDSSVNLPEAKKDYRLIKDYEFIDQNGNHDYQHIVAEFKDDGYLDKGVVMYGQGTSSMEYPVKNLRFKANGKDENGNKYKFQVNKDDCPVNLVCLKADYMESSGSHNTGTANLVYDIMHQNGKDFLSPAQKFYADKVDYSLVTSIRGYPIALFYREDENTPFKFVGKYNFNLDKGTHEPFGFFNYPEEYDPSAPEKFGWDDEGNNAIHCYEFLNNASPLDNFLSDDGETFETTFYKQVQGDKGMVPNWFLSFESRYPEGEADDGSDINVGPFFRMANWVNSTNPDDATNEPLGEAKYGYTTDSSDYRLAKFRNEFTQYFDMTFAAMYYVLTQVLLMIDSRAKNMMLATWDNTIWYPIFYDMDTMLGLNNYGYNKYNYDVEDTDANVFNGQNSVLWNNFRKAFPDEIKKYYNQMEKTGMSYSNLIKTFNTLQADALNEVCYNADSQYKYIRPLTEGYINSVSGDMVYVPPGSADYLYASQGRRSMHRKWWLENRLNYLDGEYLSDVYKNDKFIMRLYTPQVAETYYAIVALTEDTYVPNKYYTKSGETYILATGAFDSNETYYREVADAIGPSLEAVPPNNDFRLTPLHNQYLSVAYGGENGEITAPLYTKANDTALIKAPGTYNDTETYIYGGSMLKDLGDLSSQYLGRFVFPDKVSKLETLILGNKNNKYYNPNFSSLEIGNKAPYLKKLDITNCSGLGNRTLNLSACGKLQELYATGSELTGVSLPEHGIIKELRLPSSLKSLTIIDQPYLDDEHFTIGKYDSDSGSYGANNFSRLSSVHIEDVPNLNTYNIIKGGSALQTYYFKNIQWEINDSSDLETDGRIKVLERMINGETSGLYPEDTLAKSLNGTLTINCPVEDAYTIYNYYWNIFPELNIVFTNTTNNIYNVNILDGNGNIYWTKKISANGNIDDEFLATGPNGEFTIPTMAATAQYSYTFTNRWNVRYADGSTNQISSEKPYLTNITQDLILEPIFDKTINQYLITIYNGNETLLSESYDYGTKLSEIVPLTDPYKNDTTLAREQTYKFMGYAINKQYADAGIVINNLDEIIVTKATNYYTVHNQVSVYDNILDNKYFDFTTYEDGYSISLNKTYSAIKGKITLPTMYNGKPILNIRDFQSCANITHVFFALENRQVKKINYTGGSFQGDINLRWFEMIDSITSIGSQTFSGCGLLFDKWSEDEVKNFFKNIEEIGDRAFVSTGGSGLTFRFPGKLHTLKERAFYYAKLHQAIFGDIGDPSQYNPNNASLSNNNGLFDNSEVAKVTFYVEDTTDSKWDIVKNQIGTINQDWTWEVIEA